MSDPTIHIPDFVQHMNQLGKDGIPFAFLIDFEMQKPRIWKLSEPQEEFCFNFNGRTNNISSSAATKQAVLLKKEPIAEAVYQKKIQHHHWPYP